MITVYWQTKEMYSNTAPRKVYSQLLPYIGVIFPHSTSLIIYIKVYLLNHLVR